MSLFSKLRSTLRPAQLQSDLDDELQFHIDRRADELIAQGMAPEVARHEAGLRFGNQTAMKERAHDRDVLVWLETAMQDIRYAFRTLLRNPGFAATAILSLALGIGANTALFSIADSLLLKRLPVRDPESLVVLTLSNPNWDHGTFSYPLFDAVRRNSRMLTGVAAVSFASGAIREESAAVPARVDIVSGEYFSVLGVDARAGNLFRDSLQPLAVISESFWHSHYASNDVLGKPIRVNAKTYTIAGVAANFRGSSIDWPTDVWVPLEQAIPADNPRRQDAWNYLELIARRSPQATTRQIGEELNALHRGYLEQQAGNLHFEHPQQRANYFAQSIRVEPGATGMSYLRLKYAKPLLIVVGIAGIVLLIACVNLANLMLARATAREREIATRKAIGAGRARLIRQLLTECGVVVMAGAAAALIFAQWLSGALLAFFPEAGQALPNLSFHLDVRVLGLMLAISLLTCLLAGLAPAIRASGRPRPGSSAGGRALIATEIALCTVLLIGSLWFARTLWNLRSLDAGFNRDQILLSTVTGPAGLRGPALAARFDEVRQRISAVPGVAAAGFSNLGLLSGGINEGGVDVEATATGGAANAGASTYLRVSPGFFSAMETPRLAGRDFSDADVDTAPKVAIVNEAFAKRFFGDVNVLGKRFGERGPKSSRDIEIVGLVKDTKYENLRETMRPIYYTPFGQSESGEGMVIAVRSSGNLAAIYGAVRDILHEADPRVNKVMRFSTIIDDSLASERMIAKVSAGFGGLALLVACVGIYGVLAYRVARRTRELGVRLALGATRQNVRWIIVRESLLLLGIGMAAGIPAALGLSKFVKSLLFGLTPSDPWAIVGALGTLAVVSVAAAYLPARRASRIDPISALRCE
jgi:predicted permease